MYATKYYKKKITILTHYGNGRCACVLCGFEDVRALSIDHINGGGARHIKSLHMDFYEWLIKNDYPEGFRTLCMNCQWIARGQQSRHRLLRRRKASADTVGDLAASHLLDWAEHYTVPT